MSLALIDLWARCHRLSTSQRLLLQTASMSERRNLAERMNVTSGELETLERLFARQTGRTVDTAVSEIRRIAKRRALGTQTPARDERLAETLAGSGLYKASDVTRGT